MGSLSANYPLKDPSEQISYDPKLYLLPRTHPLQKVLKSIESDDILLNQKSLEAAGFRLQYRGQQLHIRVARHSLAPGYLFKLYLASETEDREAAIHKLIQRCVSARKLRKLIKLHKIQHFTAPRKWLYRLRRSKKVKDLPYILIVEDMQLVDRASCSRAWRTKITKSHLQELYVLLNVGYGSTALVKNIPYTKSGKFSFIDLEFPPRYFDLLRVNPYLSIKMAGLWNEMISPS